MADFITANASTQGGSLATALIAEPYIDVNNCSVEIEGDEFAVGHPLKVENFYN